MTDFLFDSDIICPDFFHDKKTKETVTKKLNGGKSFNTKFLLLDINQLLFN